MCVVFKISIKDGFGQISIVLCVVPFHHTYSEESNHSFSVHFLFFFLKILYLTDYKFGLVLGAILNTYCSAGVLIMREGRNRSWTAKQEVENRSSVTSLAWFF